MSQLKYQFDKKQINSFNTYNLISTVFPSIQIISLLVDSLVLKLGVFSFGILGISFLATKLLSNDSFSQTEQILIYFFIFIFIFYTYIISTEYSIKNRLSTSLTDKVEHEKIKIQPKPKANEKVKETVKI